MTINTFWCGDEEESSAAMLSGITPRHLLGPIVSKDGGVIFLGPDEMKTAELKSQQVRFLPGGFPVKLMNAKLQAYAKGGYIVCGSVPAKGPISFVDSWADADEARRQILETMSRKGIAAVAPTTSVGLPATSHENCVPKADVQPLLDKIKFLEVELRSNLPYLQMYKFGAGSLLVAVVSLLVWAFTGTGVPFHPVFAAMVIPAAIGLMVMAFLVRREIPHLSNSNK